MTDAEVPTEPVLVTERRGAVLVLRLNRPEARNALNPELLTAIGSAMVQRTPPASIAKVVRAPN